MSRNYKIKKYTGVGTLEEYLSLWETEPFIWGSFDCVHFVGDYLYLFKGLDIPIPQYKTALGAIRAAKRADLKSTLDSYLQRKDYPPVVGSIVARPIEGDKTTGHLLGIIVSNKAVFMSREGLCFTKLDPSIETYWEVT